jgi:hypothetical protein
MAKKKTQKLKTIIVKREKPPKFSLDFKDTTNNTKILVALEQLKSTAGWVFLTQVFQANLDELSRQIISKRGPNKEVLKDSEVDELRFKYEYLTELLEKPDYFIKQLTREEMTEVDNDPYQK